MVLTDRELDELWRAAGSFRGKHREHLEAAIENEQTLFSTVTERLIREYRDLKAIHAQAEEALGKLRATIAEPKTGDPIKELSVFERDLSHLVNDIATFNLDKQSIAKRVVGMRDKIRKSMQSLGYKGYF